MEKHHYLEEHAHSFSEILEYLRAVLSKKAYLTVCVAILVMLSGCSYPPPQTYNANNVPPLRINSSLMYQTNPTSNQKEISGITISVLSSNSPLGTWTKGFLLSRVENSQGSGLKIETWDTH